MCSDIHLGDKLKLTLVSSRADGVVKRSLGNDYEVHVSNNFLILKDICLRLEKKLGYIYVS